MYRGWLLGKEGKESGFTLIELVMVIVILGILAAIAIPKYMDLSINAKKSEIAGFAGSMASAGAANYAACKVNGHVQGTAHVATALDPCTTPVGCDTLAVLLTSGALPNDSTGAVVTITGTAAAALTAGTTATCTITGADVTAVGAGIGTLNQFQITAP